MNDHVETIAKEILNDVNSVEGVEGKLWKVCIYVSFITMFQFMFLTKF